MTSGGTLVLRASRQARSDGVSESYADLLREAEERVSEDPAIRGGEPVFRGTRVPVHLVADLREQGATYAELCADYPRLSPRDIRLAAVYAQAHPKGPPLPRPWQR